MTSLQRQGKKGIQEGTEDKPIPFHGYYYRMLKAQGKNAAGGAYDYVVKGKMIGGFAVVAYPGKVRKLRGDDLPREP